MNTFMIISFILLILLAGLLRLWSYDKQVGLFSLRSYNKQMGGTNDMILFGRLLDGRTIPIDIPQNATIDDLQNTIEQIVDYKVSLYYSGRRLNKDMSISESGLSSEAVIDLRVFKPPGFIVHPIREIEATIFIESDGVSYVLGNKDNYSQSSLSLRMNNIQMSEIAIKLLKLTKVTHLSDDMSKMICINCYNVKPSAYSDLTSYWIVNDGGIYKVYMFKLLYLWSIISRKYVTQNVNWVECNVYISNEEDITVEAISGGTAQPAKLSLEDQEIIKPKAYKILNSDRISFTLIDQKTLADIFEYYYDKYSVYQYVQ